MPLFSEFGSLSGYFKFLLSLKTYDIQPVRDLTLYFDWIIFKETGINTFILQNVLYWFLACIQLDKLLKRIFLEVSELETFVYISLFAVYPLFAATISWGIARKHILAFMFIVVATNYFFKIIQNDSFKKLDIVILSFSYLFSIFSQPITLLWVFWATVYLALYYGRKRVFYFALIPSYFSFLICFVANLIYYERSSTFKLFFESKTSDALNIPDKILGLGHYIYQLFLPYWPAVSYQLGHWSVFAGLILAALFVLLYFNFKLNKKNLLVWSGFALFPLVVVLSNPQILSDNYLLVPSVGFLVLVVTIINSRKQRSENFLIFSIPIFLFWSFYTFKETKLWLDPLEYSIVRNFERRPTCDSAVNLARKSYAIKGVINSGAKSYLEEYDCLNPILKTPGHAISYIFLQTYIYYYEEGIELSKRISLLEKLSLYNFYPKLVLASLYVKNGIEDKALTLVEEVYDQKYVLGVSSQLDFLISNTLYPFCINTKNVKCIKVAEKFATDPNVPYY